ncbi:MAG: FAD-dependent thymidylate synthase [Verrucomicrobia bacterium]|nr:FAD-dependent thymidylate synthase [Verrucomicrobiota bacterium]
MIENYETFSPQQIKILNRYVTNTTSNIFCLRNLPEVIKGALFSRYSRSSLGLRSLLLKEFIMSEETAFNAIVSSMMKNDSDDRDVEDQIMAIKKAQNFYDRILDGYGDDSIGELGGGHLALENVSMLAAKVIEDCRIGGSPLEKSTRYIYFDQKVGGEYLYYREPILMTSAFRELYLQTCNRLYETYSTLIPQLTLVMEKKFPKEQDVSLVAYTAAIRAKVLDCLRGLLPTSALTNMGVFGNGRFFEGLLQKLNGHNLAEMQDIGKKGFQELSKIMPSFVRRAEPNHKYQQTFTQFTEQLRGDLRALAEECSANIPPMTSPGVRLISYDLDAPTKVAAAMMFEYSNSGLLELQAYCRSLPEDHLNRILETGSNFRENRRHKSPRALEHALFTFELVADFGAYRDLQRHRMLTQERQLLTCDLGYFVPTELRDTPMEKPYCDAMDEAKLAFDQISLELPEEAQYVVPMGYNIHWYFHVNLRALQWLCELRSSPAGHSNYRYIAQELAKQVSKACPQFERFFKFVDYDGYQLGRLGQEIRTAQKRKEHV